MAIALAETVTGSTPDQASFTLTSWTPGANELVLVFVAIRDETKTVTVSGNGLTFVESINLDNAQGQNGVHVFRAMAASPTTGQITVSIASNTLPVFAVACRFTGMDTSGTNGSGAVEATGTAAGPPVTDDDDMQGDVTTVTANAWAVAVGTHRNSTFTVPGGQTQISINNTVGSGGALTSCSVWYKAVVSPAATTLGGANDLSAVNDWCVGLVSIRPAGGTTYNQSAAGTLTTAGALTAIRTVYLVLAGTLSSAGALTRKAKKSLGGTLTTAGSLTKKTFKAFAGTLTSAGGLTSQTLQIFYQAVGGALTMAGALTRKGKKSLAGTLTTGGALVRKAKKALAGTLTTAGALVTGLPVAAVAFTLHARRLALTLSERLRTFTLQARGAFTLRDK